MCLVSLLVLVGAVLSPGTLAAADAEAESAGFAFGVLGDFPYFARDYEGMPELLRDLREDDELEFVVHLGDLHNPRYTPCSETFFRDRLAVLSELGRPFVLTPGDNDWADCAEDPIGELATLRKVFFSKPGWASGPNAFALRSQGQGGPFPDVVENAIWQRDRVVFATLHMISPSALPFLDATAEAREHLIAAGEAWLDEVFVVAHEQDARGVFLATQASLWPISGSALVMEFAKPDLLDQAPAFANFKAKLVKHVRAFGGPVVLAHGDTHYFRIDKPLIDENLEQLETFTRLEGFGSPKGHWVRVFVDANRPEVFSFRSELVSANLNSLDPATPSGLDEATGGLRKFLPLVRVVRATPTLLAWFGAFVLLSWCLRGFRRSIERVRRHRGARKDQQGDPHDDRRQGPSGQTRS